MHESMSLLKESSNYTSDFGNFSELAHQAGSVVKLLPAGFAARR
jgi:hypothetical protein